MRPVGSGSLCGDRRACRGSSACIMRLRHEPACSETSGRSRLLDMERAVTGGGRALMTAIESLMSMGRSLVSRSPPEIARRQDSLPFLKTAFFDPERAASRGKGPKRSLLAVVVARSLRRDCASREKPKSAAPGLNLMQAREIHHFLQVCQQKPKRPPHPQPAYPHRFRRARDDGPGKAELPGAIDRPPFADQSPACAGARWG